MAGIRFLGNISAVARIVFVVMIPVAGLLCGAAYEMAQKRDSYLEAERLISIGRLAVSISGVIREVQLERGKSMLFMGLRDDKSRSAVESQRRQTDAFVEQLGGDVKEMPQAHIGGEFGRSYAKAEKLLAAISERRKDVDSAASSIFQVMDGYGEIVEALIGAVGSLAGMAADGDIAMKVVAYVSVMQAMENAGRERGGGVFPIIAGKFSGEDYRRIIGYTAAQDAYWAALRIYADEEQAKALDAALADPIVKEARKMRAEALSGGEGGVVRGIDAATWFSKHKAAHEVLQAVEDKIGTDIQTAAQDSYRRNKSLFVRTLWTTGGILGFVLVLLAAILHSIVASLKRLKKATDALVNNTSISRTVEELQNAFSEMQKTSTTISTSADQTLKQSSELSGVACDMNDMTQSVASATEELSSSIACISQQVSHSTEIVNEALRESKHSETAMSSLAEAAGRIGDAVKLIGNIAGQTNLLALNATIEAARAGESGKGFSVVASEVKTLAGQTERATGEVSQLVASIQTGTEQAVAALKRMIPVINRVNAVASEISSSVDEQSTATKEIARNIQRVLQGSNSVRDGMGCVSSAASQSSKIAEELLSTSQGLSQKTGDLRVEIEGFMAAIKG